MLHVLAGARWWPGDRTIVAAPYHGRSDGRLCRLGKTGLASSCVVITSHRPVLRPPEPQGPFTAAEVDHIEGKRTRINEKSREEKARRAFFKQICLSACFKQSVNAYKILSKRTVFIATTLYVPALYLKRALWHPRSQDCQNCVARRMYDRFVTLHYCAFAE